MVRAQVSPSRDGRSKKREAGALPVPRQSPDFPRTSTHPNLLGPGHVSCQSEHDHLGIGHLHHRIHHPFAPDSTAPVPMAGHVICPQRRGVVGDEASEIQGSFRPQDSIDVLSEKGCRGPCSVPSARRSPSSRSRQPIIEATGAKVSSWTTFISSLTSSRMAGRQTGPSLLPPARTRPPTGLGLHHSNLDSPRLALADHGSRVDSLIQQIADPHGPGLRT